MGLLDTFKKNKEKKVDHTTPPPKGDTLAQILQDKQRLYLFGELLREQGDKDLGKKMREGKLEESDIAILEERRKLFTEKMDKSEKVEKLITKENIIDFARNNPEFEKIINLVGPEKAIKAIQSQMKEISITDAGRFDAIVYAMGEYEKEKSGDYKAVNDRVEKLLKEKNITQKEYLDILDMSDPVEKEKALKGLAKKYGKKWFGRMNKDLLVKLRDSESDLEDAITKLNIENENVGQVLSLTVSGNDTMRNALFGELLDEKKPEKPKLAFNEVKKGTFDEAKWQEDWEACKKAKKFASETPSVQDVIRNDFKQEQQKAYKDKKGTSFWEEIIASFTKRVINGKKLE